MPPPLMLPAMNLDPQYNFDTEHFDAEDAANFLTAHPVIVQVLKENTSDLARNMNHISELIDIMRQHHETKRAYLKTVQRSKTYVKIARNITQLCTLSAAIIFIGALTANLQPPQSYAALIAGGVFTLIALYSGHLLYIFANAANQTAEIWNKTLTENRVLINASILNLALDTNTDFLKSALEKSEYRASSPTLTAH